VEKSKQEKIDLLMQSKNILEIIEKNEKKFKVIAESKIESISIL